MGLILGINAHHGDSAACIIDDNRVIAAAEEERFRRVKHWMGFPSKAVEFCLAEAGASFSDIEHVAVNRDPRASWGRRLAFVVTGRPTLAKVLDRVRTRWRARGVLADLEGFAGCSLRARLHQIEHHSAHLASAALVAPFDECVVVSVDQFGDFASSAWGLAKGGRIRVDGRVHFPHSLGTFYTAATQFLGFPSFGDEYKVMGLAPYGQPRHLPEMRSIVRTLSDGSFELDLRFFRHATERVEFTSSDGCPLTGDLFSPAFEELLGPRRRREDPVDDRVRDIAASAQARYEEVFFHLLRALHARYGVSQLALAGGCAQNSVANGKIPLATPFRRVYVAAAAGDGGGALGAALAVRARVFGRAKPLHLDHAYLGPQFLPSEVESLLAASARRLESERCQVRRIPDESQLCAETARHLRDGLVVGWFQGRMEWGPRALGNRSILADPRRADIRELLNAKIKRRECFRPFAPSVMREHAEEWFDLSDDIPFMSSVVPVRPERRAAIPAVTHVDGSARVQTVRPTQNRRYHALLRAFRDLTGVPMVLNTSFNENEPIVCRPAEALDCFLRTRMDVLVLGDFLLKR